MRGRRSTPRTSPRRSRTASSGRARRSRAAPHARSSTGSRRSRRSSGSDPGFEHVAARRSRDPRGEARRTIVIAVIFEVFPAGGARDEYLAMAAALKPQLEQADGFISIERFESLYTPGKLLSLQF